MKEFKRFPMILMSVIAFMAVTSLSGCESPEERELRLERNHEARMEYIQRPVAPGSYIDYRGNTLHGYWQNGNWYWNNPQSHYAVSSGHYVDYGMATGSLSVAALTYAAFNRNNSNGWVHTEVTVNNYTSTDGDTISKEKYTKRNKSLTKKKQVQAKKRAKKAKAKSPKTVSKSTGIKKDDKWKSKRTAEPEFGKKGFKNKFYANKQRAAKAKKKHFADKKASKSTYSKPKQKPRKKPSKPKKRTK